MQTLWLNARTENLVMPLYEYTCAVCGRKQEVLRRMAERAKQIECDKCRGHMELEVSAPHGIVKNPAVPRGGK